jgi:hypothetical protein
MSDKVIYAESYVFLGTTIIHEYLENDGPCPEIVDHRLVYRTGNVEVAGDVRNYMAMCHLHVDDEHYAGTTDFYEPDFPRCFRVETADEFRPFKPSATEPTFFDQSLSSLDRETNPVPNEVGSAAELPAVSTSAQHGS